MKDSKASGGQCVIVTPDKQSKTPVEYIFNVPQDDEYYILMRLKSDTPVRKYRTLMFAVDKEKMKPANFKNRNIWSWEMTANNNARWTGRLKAYRLKKGRHTIKFMPKQTMYLDLIGVTNSPKVFEPK